MPRVTITSDHTVTAWSVKLQEGAYPILATLYQPGGPGRIDLYMDGADAYNLAQTILRCVEEWGRERYRYTH